jgi:protein TonB
MFEQTFVDTGKTKKTWTVMTAFAGQIAFISVLVVLPMIFYEGLPTATLQAFLTAPPPPPPPPPPPAAAPPVHVVKVIPRQFDAGRLTAPKIIPKEVATIKEEELPPPTMGVSGVVGGVAGGTPGGVLGGIISAVPTAAPPPPPPPPKPVEKAAAPTRIKIGGAVQQAKLVRQPHPVYPPLAKQARISGVVKLSAIISKDGTIQKLEVISGHPLLAPAALEAVKQWVYQPTLLNGEPVEVVTQIDVNFTLSQ